jgi:hypothetical protein
MQNLLPASMCSRVGRFLTFFTFLNKRHAGIRVLLVKTWKIQKRFFRSIDLYRRGHYILGHALYRGQKICFTMWAWWVSKDTEFYVDFKNINLPLWQNAPKKSNSKIKIFITIQGAPCVQTEIFILGLLFLGAFFH